MNLTQKINKFRLLLQTYSDNDSCFATKLLNNFNDLFPERIFSDEMDYLRDLTVRYCYQDIRLCPICGGPMTKSHQKSIARHKFLGCNNYPACRGARSDNGAPSINDAMREFLSQKVKEDDTHEDIASSRFRDLDL